MRCLLIDDEPRALDVLQTHVAALPTLRLAGVYPSAVQAFEALQREALAGTPVELMFLDITMPRLTGLDFLRSLEKPPLTILTTAYHEYALQGYELDVVDYLLKPISFPHFLRAVQKAARRLHLPEIAPTRGASNDAASQKQSDERFLYFRVERKMVKVFLRDVCVVESLKDYVQIIVQTPHGSLQKLITKQSMNALELMLPSEEFVRVHRSYIVAVKKISSYTASTLDIAGMAIPIGRGFKGNFRENVQEL
jgi:DNA-binding LytR/AlgR family response regulator